MRRLVLLVAVIVLLAPGSAGAAGARLSVTAGSAKAVGGELRGWFTVANLGSGRSRPIVATVTVAGGRPPLKIRTQWIARKAKIPALAPSAKHRVQIAAPIPTGFATEHQPIKACVAGECRQLGKLTVAGNPVHHPSHSPAPSAPLPLDHDIAPSPAPEESLTYTPGEPFHHTAGGVEYWGFVPYSYDPATPTPLLIWLHGCGGDSEGDIWVVDPEELEGEPQDWLTLALGGREGGCWDPPADEPKVLEALANFETHFNVDPRRVILGGYSSGGDLAYRTGFFHSSTFAGLLIVNSAPFRDTDASEEELLGAATTKFHIVHVAHEEDDTYELAEVRSEVEAVEDADFPIELIEVPGEHWNEPGDIVEGAPVPGTDADILTYLLPHMDDGWESP